MASPHFCIAMFKSLLSRLLITSLCASAFVTSISGQTMRSEIEILQEAFGLEKKAAVAQFMDLGDNSSIFWSLYDAYEAERKQLGNRRIEVLQEYARNFSNLSEDKILELLKRTNAIKKSFDKLQTQYFNQMRKELGANTAAQFWQLESYFNVMVLSTIYKQIPFIGEGIEDK